jgi:lipopolysaccharide exporter
MSEAQAPARFSLRRAIAANGAGVLIGAHATSNLMRVATSLILTRLLAPEAFGVVGIVVAISFVLSMLSDMGFHAFVIRAKRDDKRFLDVIWTIRLARCVALTLIMFVFAGPLAAAFDKPELETVVRATSFLFLIEGARSLAFFTAERQRRVSYVTAVEFSVFLLQTAVALVAAMVLRSYWAIVIAMYANALALTVFSYVFFRHSGRALAFDREVARELWLFARVVIASSMITLILAQADKIVIGRLTELGHFGLYMLAVSIAAAPAGLIRSFVIRVILPVYAEAQRKAPETLARLFYAARQKFTLAFAFLLGGGVGGGPLIIEILFDERYHGAGVYFSILCVAPLLLLSTMPAEQYAIVLGRLRATLESNLARLAWIVIAAPAGYALGGVLGLVIAFGLVEIAPYLYWTWRLKTLGAYDLRSEALMLAAGGGGAAVGLAGLIAAQMLKDAGLWPLG